MVCVHRQTVNLPMLKHYRPLEAIEITSSFNHYYFQGNGSAWCYQTNTVHYSNHPRTPLPWIHTVRTQNCTFKRVCYVLFLKIFIRLGHLLLFYNFFKQNQKLNWQFLIILQRSTKHHTLVTSKFQYYQIIYRGLY